MTAISIIVITAAIFFAAVLNLATENRFRNRIIGLCTAAAVVMGLLIYGYGFACTLGASPLAVLRALFAVCRMFGGVNDLGSIQAAPLFASSAALVVFWCVHFMAFYVTASAAITTIGGKVLRRIRATLLRRGTLLILFGANENALEYGRRQIARQRRSVVLMDADCSAAIESAANASGMVVEKGGHVLSPDAAFLRRMGIVPGKRRIEVAALHEDSVKNTVFAQSLLDAFKQQGIHSEQTALLAQGIEEDHAASMNADENTYGYGSVLAFDEYDLAARLMVQKLPPCDTISFDENARAKEDFTALIVGFGRTGRAVLEQLVMNGQFAGSSFRADVFDPSAQTGVLFGHEMLRQYDIRFHEADGKSAAFYDFLTREHARIRYIVLCTGSDRTNREIALDLNRWFREHGSVPAIVQCTKCEIMYSRAGTYDLQYQRLYGSDALELECIDRMAMAINHIYCSGSVRTAAQNWQRCDYFSRMSSRASADFYPAMLRAAGRTAEEVMAGQWPPEDKALENLAVTEHMRWCAFHYVMGFTPMDEETYAARAAQYLAEKKKNGTSSLRIGKDMAHRRHACLIPWEELDALSARENAITGGQVNYKQMDRNNVLVLPEILCAVQTMTDEHKGGTAQ